MSIHDTIKLTSSSVGETQQIAKSLTQSLYLTNKLTILLSGEVGTGKTTFVQGFAQGLGIADSVTSPTFALEQRYGNQLMHVDLYRLLQREADQHLMATEDFPGIRIIEWPQRASRPLSDQHIEVRFEDTTPTERTVTMEFLDVAIPDDRQIGVWLDEVRLPEHIRTHMAQVSRVAEASVALLRDRNVVVRPAALRAAALMHDILRFVDFQSLAGDAIFTPSTDQTRHWQQLKMLYGTPHELAAQRFCTERGYAAIGQIIATHGAPRDGRTRPQTIEQKVLAYADKRVRFDDIVGVDERFDDFLRRYGGSEETDFSILWRKEMKALEQELFPDGAPTL